MTVAFGSAARTMAAAPSPGELSTRIRLAWLPANARARAVAPAINEALWKLTTTTSRRLGRVLTGKVASEYRCQRKYADKGHDGVRRSEIDRDVRARRHCDQRDHDACADPAVALGSPRPTPACTVPDAEDQRGDEGEESDD